MRRRDLLVAPLALVAGCNRSGKKRVAVVPKGTNSIFWVTVHAGAAAAGEQFGLEILWNGPPAETDFARQIQIMDSMIAQHVDGIVMAASDRKALVAPVERATREGIPVTVFDSGLDSTNYMSYVATDNVDGGRMAGRAMGKLLGGKGKVGIIMHMPGSVSTTDRETGFKEIVQKEFPGIQVVQELFGMGDPAKVMAAAENILTAHTDLDGFFCSAEPGSLGTSQAVKSRGLKGKLKLVAFDSSDSMIEDMRNGVIQAMVVQDPFKMGFEAVRTIADKLSGKEPPKRIDLAAVVVTPENIDTPDIKKLLYPDVKKYVSS